MLIAAVLSVFFASANRKAEKDGAILTNAEALADVIPVCETMKLGVAMLAMAVIVLVIGLIAASNFAWFAIGMVFATVAAAFSAIMLVPSVFLVLRAIFAKKEAEKARYDYKK
jgi:4-hydroxybenzoate polyprenyltransferase